MRRAEIERNTLETKIKVSINLDGTGEAKLNTGLPFFDHMLHQIARHGLFDIDIVADGDLEVDAHHTVEDVGITLGQAFTRALGEKTGIYRYGHAYVPLDEALSRVVIDLSGRPGNHALITVHLDNLRGLNAHHQAETLFKAFGRALRMAVEPDPRMGDILPSTKGAL